MLVGDSIGQGRSQGNTSPASRPTSTWRHVGHDQIWNYKRLKFRIIYRILGFSDWGILASSLLGHERSYGGAATRLQSGMYPSHSVSEAHELNRPRTALFRGRRPILEICLVEPTARRKVYISCRKPLLYIIPLLIGVYDPWAPLILVLVYTRPRCSHEDDHTSALASQGCSKPWKRTLVHIPIVWAKKWAWSVINSLISRLLKDWSCEYLIDVKNNSGLFWAAAITIF